MEVILTISAVIVDMQSTGYQLIMELVELLKEVKTEIRETEL